MTPAQETAVAGLLAGKSVTDAAADAAVTRETVHRWLRENFAFQAELNRGRRELRESVQTRLERLAGKAAACVEKAIDGGDTKAALEVLKGLGASAPPSIGADDPAGAGSRSGNSTRRTARQLAAPATIRRDDGLGYNREGRAACFPPAVKRIK